LAVFGVTRGGIHSLLQSAGLAAMQLAFPRGVARLREHKGGWSIAPSLRFVETIMGDKFRIDDLGQSARYRLLKLTVRRPEVP
jgi:hypothetical protein